MLKNASYISRIITLPKPTNTFSFDYSLIDKYGLNSNNMKNINTNNKLITKNFEDEKEFLSFFNYSFRILFGKYKFRKVEIVKNIYSDIKQNYNMYYKYNFNGTVPWSFCNNIQLSEFYIHENKSVVFNLKYVNIADHQLTTRFGNFNIEEDNTKILLHLSKIDSWNIVHYNSYNNGIICRINETKDKYTQLNKKKEPLIYNINNFYNKNIIFTFDK